MAVSIWGDTAGKMYIMPLDIQSVLYNDLLSDKIVVYRRIESAPLQ